jgi:xanthine dehydrogenase iron-sulfur cluster and FAD-binding subunit A
VLLDGELVNSCLVPVAQVDGRDVRTVEGLAGEGELDPLQRAFLESGGTQCGLCAPGMLLAARALLASGRPVTDGAIREAIAGNLCRCTGYTKIVESIATAAELAEADAWSAWPQVGGSARPMEARAMAGGTDLVRPASLDEALARLAERGVVPK